MARVQDALDQDAVTSMFAQLHLWMGNQIRQGDSRYAVECERVMEEAYDELYEPPAWILEMEKQHEGEPVDDAEEISFEEEDADEATF